MSMPYDIVVFDKEDWAVLVVKVIRVKNFDEETKLFYYQEANKYAERMGADYVLVAAPSKMELRRSSSGKVLTEFDTVTALAPYIGEEFTVKEVSKHYLKVSIMLWLDDLIYPWKETEAPYKKELKSLGILEQLEYVRIRTEANKI